MEGPPSSYDCPSQHIPPADSVTTNEAEMARGGLFRFGYLRLATRCADIKRAEPTENKARRNSYAPSQMVI